MTRWVTSARGTMLGSAPQYLSRASHASDMIFKPEQSADFSSTLLNYRFAPKCHPRLLAKTIFQHQDHRLYSKYHIMLLLL